MPIRNSHRVGDYLMTDDRTGFVHYRSEMVKLWNGLWVHKDDYETRQPQEFVMARSDPKPLRDVRPEQATLTSIYEGNRVCDVVGNTAVQTKSNPASHLFKAGIGCMQIQGFDNLDTIFEVEGPGGFGGTTPGEPEPGVFNVTWGAGNPVFYGTEECTYGS